MRNYEAMYILKPGFEEEKYEAIVEKFNALIQNDGGEIIKVDIWGKRKLAYEIDKITEGYYVLINFKAQTSFAAELERNFRINDNVIRYLITQQGEK